MKARAGARIENGLHLVGDLVLCEVPRGFRDAHRACLARELLALCGPVVFGGRELARRAAAYHRELCERGLTPRKTVDLPIGTWCIVNRVPLLHRDRDFLPLVRQLGLGEARPIG